MPDQRSLTDQLTSLYALANKHGMYDAADFVRAMKDKVPPSAPAQVFDPGKVRELLEKMAGWSRGDASVSGAEIEDAAQAVRESEVK